MDEVAQDFSGVEFGEVVGGVFNFLPDPITTDTSGAETNTDPTTDTASYRPARRSLVEDNNNSVTWQWHPTARGVYGQEANVHERWQSILEEPEAKPGEQYSPFSSRLDWEASFKCLTPM
jgi:hypothetical protein